MAPRAAACQARARPGFAVPHVTRPITQAAPVGRRATHGLSLTGLEPRFITAELTLADTNPQMAELKPLAAESLAAAEREIDAQWVTLAT